MFQPGVNHSPLAGPSPREAVRNPSLGSQQMRRIKPSNINWEQVPNLHCSRTQPQPLTSAKISNLLKLNPFHSSAGMASDLFNQVATAIGAACD